MNNFQKYAEHHDYIGAISYLKSLKYMEFEEEVLYAGYSTISRKAHGKRASINWVIGQMPCESQRGRKSLPDCSFSHVDGLESELAGNLDWQSGYDFARDMYIEDAREFYDEKEELRSMYLTTVKQFTETVEQLAICQTMLKISNGTAE